MNLILYLRKGTGPEIDRKTGVDDGIRRPPNNDFRDGSARSLCVEDDPRSGSVTCLTRKGRRNLE